MEVKIVARHFEMTDDLRDRVEKAIEKISRQNSDLIWLEVVLEQEKTKDHRKKVEFIAHTKDQHTVIASEESDNFFTSINRATEKLLRQFRKIKTKQKPWS